MAAAARPDKINQRSQLLQDHENEEVFKLIGHRCKALSTVVAEVHLLVNNEWKKEHVGVACFVKDSANKSYFIRLIDLKLKAIVWEYDLKVFHRKNFQCNAMTQNFYSICENGQVFAGLNFSDTNEAQHFRQTVEKELERRRQSIIVRKPNISGRAPPRPPSRPTRIAPPPPPHRSVRYTYRNVPNDPKIVLEDPRWFALFVHIGITQAQLDDEETFKELYAFVQTNGGIETARMKLPQNEYGKYNGLAPPPLRGFAGSSDHPFQASTNPVALTRNRCDRRTLRGPSTRNCEDTYDTGSLNTQTVPRKSSGDWRVKQLDSWTVEDVCDWLKDISLEEYCELFRFHAIDGVELLEQNEESLVDALKIEPFGHRRKIMRNLTKLLEKEKEEEKRTKEKEEETPDEFLCPITQELMTDPVIVADGYTYERASITQWFETGNNRSPMTNLPLENRNLVPNRSLKDAINRHLGQ